MAYDPVDHYVLLFGGEEVFNRGSTFIPLNDTWEFADSSWVNVTATVGPAPAPRAYAPLSYDVSDGYMLLIGGHIDFGVPSPNCDPYCNDTWSFLHGRWGLIHSQPAGGLRSFDAIASGAAYDSTDGFELVQTGGTTPSDGTTFSYRAGVFTDISHNVSTNKTMASPGFSGSVMADDPAEHGVILFGGEVPVSGYAPSNDTWLFSAGNWTNITASAGPSPQSRVNAAGDYDYESGGLVVFGGDLGVDPFSNPTVGGTWLFSGGRWSDVTPTVTPDATAASTMGWDPTGNVSLLFGGIAGSQTSNATWEWGESTFTALRANFTYVVDSESCGGTGGVTNLVTLTGNATGGTPPYSFKWSLPTGAASGPKVDTTTAWPWGRNVTLNVTDSAGRLATHAASIPMILPPCPPPAPLEATFSEGGMISGTCNPFTADVTLFANATGGDPPYTFTWYFGPGDPLERGPEVSHTFHGWGTYSATLWVVDSAGTNASMTKPVEAPPAPGCPPPVNVFSGAVLIAGGVAVGVGATGVAYLILQRRKK